MKKLLIILLSICLSPILLAGFGLWVLIGLFIAIVEHYVLPGDEGETTEWWFNLRDKIAG